MSIEEVIEKLEEMYRMDNPVMYGKRGTIKAAIEILQKQKEKKPIHIKDNGVRYTDSYRCPNCKKGFSGTGIAAYCYHCGQKLDWSENDE